MTASDPAWTWKCERVIPSDAHLGRHVLDELLHELEARHWSRRDIFCIHLAVHEALVNAIVHGNCGDREKTVHVAAQISPKCFRVEITDQGPGFDPQSLPDPTDCTHLECSGGRGVLLMRAFMSRVSYPSPGNRVILEKDRS
ncbi:MAG: ATP-binding protein [Pirellulales bacterium]|nr:ATP-binding protein [Pirellulales bacterium]